MSRYTCYIIDDEPLAIDVVVNYLERIKSFEIKGAFTNPVDAFVALKEQPVDLIFIDIEMPDFSGLDFIRSLEKCPDIIITTAYREFAVEGFDLSICDYLLKPITFERFMKAIDKFLSGRQKRQTEVKVQDSFMMVRADRKHIKISFDDIVYIQGLKDYVKIVTTQKQVLTKQSIGSIQKLLNPAQFIRVHRSYIVSRKKITAYTNYDVELGDVEIPIGRKYKGDVMEDGKLKI